MNWGEIWWVEHPNAGRRPFLVLTRQEAIGVLNHVVAVQATTTIRGAPSEVVLEAADGMPQRCVLSFDNIQTVWKGYFREYICRLPVDRAGEVCRTLRTATGC